MILCDAASEGFGVDWTKQAIWGCHLGLSKLWWIFLIGISLNIDHNKWLVLALTWLLLLCQCHYKILSLRFIHSVFGATANPALMLSCIKITNWQLDVSVFWFVTFVFLWFSFLCCTSVFVALTVLKYTPLTLQWRAIDSLISALYHLVSAALSRALSYTAHTGLTALDLIFSHMCFGSKLRNSDSPQLFTVYTD